MKKLTITIEDGEEKQEFTMEGANISVHTSKGVAYVDLPHTTTSGITRTVEVAKYTIVVMPVTPVI